MKMRLSLAQMHIQSASIAENLENASALIRSAAHQDADMVLLPELWSSGYDLPHAARWAAANADLQPALTDLARQYQIWIGGSLLEQSGDKVFNTFSLIDPDGQRQIAYRKLHLFRPMDEDLWLQAGNNLVTLTLPWATTGLAVCYDLRFPEQFRQYALQGAELILLVAEWPRTRAEHWRTLLRARAIENQAFVAAVNAVGESGGTVFAGQSMLIDPWGNVLASGSDSTQDLITAELDFSLVEQIRRTIPVFRDRRPDVYG
jgi:predicted amidohydrolase